MSQQKYSPDINAALEDPILRRTIQKYWMAEIERMDAAVFTPLQKMVPGLDGFLDTLRTSSDPIVSLQEIRWFLDNTRKLEDMLSQKDYCSLPGIQAVFSALESIRQYDELLHAPAELRTKGFHVAMAYSLQDESRRTGKTIDAVVSDRVLTDSALRSVFPQRVDAEHYYALNHNDGEQCIVFFRQFADLAKQFGILDDAALNELRAGFPGKREFSLFSNALKAYNSINLARIYADA